MVLVDTTIWSEFFRRGTPQPVVHRQLRELIFQRQALMLGAVRQELLSGIKHHEQSEVLRDAIRAFDDHPTTTTDYESAAELSNLCRAKGIQGSPTDFLLCAVGVRLDLPIFTIDKDFECFTQVIPVRLYLG